MANRSERDCELKNGHTDGLSSLVLCYGRYRIPKERHREPRHHIEASCKKSHGHPELAVIPRPSDSKASEELILHKLPNPCLNSFMLLVSTTCSNNNSTVFVTRKMNFLLFAVKLLPELTTVSFGLGKIDQTPQVLYIQKQNLQAPSQGFSYHSSKPFSIFPHPFLNHGHVPVTCAVNRGNTICSLFEIPFYTACDHVSASLGSCLPRILYSVLEV